MNDFGKTFGEIISDLAESDPDSEEALYRLCTEVEHGPIILTHVDSKHLYGVRIGELYRDVCGRDIDRFDYHLSMELPCQICGELSTTGPWLAFDSPELDRHFELRRHGKPNSFWALENPPDYPDYAYPITEETLAEKAREGIVDISDLGPAKVLTALYNASYPGGMGFLQYNPEPMTEAQAQEILDGGHTRFDYVYGRAMKLDFDGDLLDVATYNRRNGKRHAERALQILRETGDVNAETIQEMHKDGMVAQAEDVMEHIDEGHTVEKRGDIAIFHIGGFADVAEHLRPAVHRALQQG